VQFDTETWAASGPRARMMDQKRELNQWGGAANMVRRDLIFDVGMHLGEDTDFYIKKGYRVVAIEANPLLVEHCKIRFSSQITSGDLVIISGAVARDRNDGIVAFYLNRNSVWGTIEEGWMVRNEKLGAPSTKIEVQAINIYSLFQQYGTPHYIKIDIEGQDLTVLSALKSLSELPPFLSIESEKVSFENLAKELDAFAELGYKKFMIVQQAIIPGSHIKTKTLDGAPLDYTFPLDSSGAFGEDLIGKWLSYDEALKAYRLIFVDYQLYGDNSLLRKFRPWDPWATRNPGWYDTHASLQR
jgi:FkbM family methyltransferase